MKRRVKHHSSPLLKQQFSTESQRGIQCISISISISMSMSVDAVCFFQLSNEMQLSIMEKVKSGELSIEDALDQARRDRMQLLKQQSQAEEVPFLPPNLGTLVQGPAPAAPTPSLL